MHTHIHPQHEIMVAPDKSFMLIVIQDPTVSNNA
jgi:hypothetical protein